MSASNTIDSGYSLAAAVDDFKKGVEFFQNHQWLLAEPLLSKARKKFRSENQQQLVLETTYILANLHLQTPDYPQSLVEFGSLEQLASGLQHIKYFETSLFMQGFCRYKLGQYSEVITILNKIDIEKSQFLGKLQYFSYLGRSFSKLKNHTQAIEVLKRALALCFGTPSSIGEDKLMAQVYYDLGLEYHQAIIDEIRKAGLKDFAVIIKTSQLFQDALDFFAKALDLWQKLQDFRSIITGHQIIGNIHGYLKNPIDQIVHYREAIYYAEKINDFAQLLKISELLIVILNNSQLYGEIIELVDRILDILMKHAYQDPMANARMYYYLGLSKFQSKNHDAALSDLLMALNILQKQELRVPVEHDTLRLLASCYAEKGALDKVSFYQSLIGEFETKFDSQTQSPSTKIGLITDFWFFTPDGLEIYSWSPSVEFDSTLFGGFVTAMQSFSLELQKDQMQSFEIGEFRFQFYMEKGKYLYLLGRTPKTLRPEVIQGLLQKIYRRFYEEFQKILENFSGDISKFARFSQIIHSTDLNCL